MLSLKKELQKSLKNAKRLAVLGIGSSLRGDDGAGLIFIKELKASLKKDRSRIPVRIFSCGTVPENFTGVIKKFKPDLIIIVDALDTAEEAGRISVIEWEKKSSNVSFSTHGLPLRMFVEYLTRSLECVIISIGIQPESGGFGLPISGKVNKSVKKLSDLISESVMY
jgi:hydrogenase 3 maturation protease